MTRTDLLDETAHDALDHTGLTGVGGGGGIDAGVTFPGSPSTDDLFHRTDLDLIFFYDGTRWLCTCLHSVGLEPFTSLSATGFGLVSMQPSLSSLQAYVEKFHAVTLVSSPNTGAAFWTVKVTYKIASNTDNDLTGATFNSSADTATTWAEHSIDVDLALPSTARAIILHATKTGSPGNLFCSAIATYRYIAT